MAITKVGQTTAVIATDSGTQDVSLPGGTTTDDIVLIIRGCDFNLNAHDITTTPAYTDIIAQDTGNDPGIHVAWKRMGATPDTTVTIEKYTGGREQAVLIQVWRGVDDTTALDVTTPTPATGAPTTTMPNAPSITPVTSGALVVAMAVLDDEDYASSTSAPSGYGDFLAADTTEGSGAGATAMIASKSWTSGAEDPPVFGGSITDQHWEAVTIALRPASTGDIDTAEKRRCVSAIHGSYFVGPGVTPNASKDQEWRQEVAYGYCGILAGGAAAASATQWRLTLLGVS